MKNIACIYIGDISLKSRLLKQINTLTKANCNVTAYIGVEVYNNRKHITTSNFNFNLIKHDIKYGNRLKMITFINQLIFW